MNRQGFQKLIFLGTGAFLYLRYSFRQCCGSMKFWYGSGSPDPYLWLMDPDPTSDPTPFFIDFKDAKKYFFPYFFLFLTCPQAHHLQSKKFNFLLKFCVKILFCRHCFSPLNIFMRKGKDPDPDPYLWLMDPNPGGLKHLDPVYPDPVPDSDPLHCQKLVFLCTGAFLNVRYTFLLISNKFCALSLLQWPLYRAV